MKKVVKPPMIVVLGLLVAITASRPEEVLSNTRADDLSIMLRVTELPKCHLLSGQLDLLMKRNDFTTSEIDFVNNDSNPFSGLNFLKVNAPDKSILTYKPKCHDEQ